MAPPLAILWANRIAAAPMLEATIPSHTRDMSTDSTGAVRIIGVIDTGIAEDKILLLPDVRRARSCTQKSRERGTPGEVGYEASTRKPRVKARSSSASGLIPSIAPAANIQISSQRCAKATEKDGLFLDRPGRREAVGGHG